MSNVLEALDAVESLDQRIRSLETRLLLTDDFTELLEREKRLEALYAERRAAGDALLKASEFRRINASTT